MISRMRTRLWAVAALLATAASLGGAHALHAQVSVDRYELHRLVGEDSVVQLLAVRNDLDSVQQVNITVADWERDSLGSTIERPLGTLAGSCGDRVEVFPRTFQIPAKSTEYVRVTYFSKPSGDAGCWALLVVEDVKPPTVNPTGQGIMIRTVNAVKLYVHPRNGTMDGAVEYAEVEEYYQASENPATPRDSTLQRRMAVRFVNAGTEHLIVKVVVEIRDAGAQLLHRLTTADAYITPDAFRDILVRIPELPAGRYFALAVLDYGVDEVVAAQADFEIP